MVDDFDEHGDDEAEDELQTRKGKFLKVEAIGDGYRETAVNGKTTDYRPNEQELEISIEGIALHATSDVGSGTIRHLLTGATLEKFRAIGTEGNYPIFDVSIGSEIAKGTTVIRHVYERDGHPLHSQMLIGLPDETVKALSEKLPGTLRIGGIDKKEFYTSGPRDEALLQDYWRDHVVTEDGSDEVTVEWQYTFDTVTLSPEGYSGGWLGYHPPSDSGRHVSGDIGIHFSHGHPLKQTIEGLAENLPQAMKSINFALLVIAAALVYIAYKAS